ncbi:MAG: protein kinase [Nanoarchaeota archaeon]
MEPLPSLQPSIAQRTYRLTEKIGEGEYGRVYKAYTNDFADPAHPWALKLFKSAKTFRRALKNEYQFLGKCLHHPHIVDYFDRSEDSRSPYLVMEYVPETLFSLVRKNKANQEVLHNYLIQIPQLLDVFRQEKIAHCDLKASNLGYKEAQLKALDFGLALPLEHSFMRPVSNVPRYCPPELRIWGMVTPTCDTYTAGKVLEFLLLGHYPQTTRQAIENIELCYDLELPNSFRNLLQRMTDEDHARRPKPKRLEQLIGKALRDTENTALFQPQEYVLWSPSRERELSSPQTAFALSPS